MSKVLSTRIFKIQFDFELNYMEEFVAASMSEDERVKFVNKYSPLKSFSDCVDKLKKFLEENDFVIDNVHGSDRKVSTSKYISCHKVVDEDGDIIKGEFYFRIADHPLDEYQEKRRRKRFKNKVVPLIEEETEKQIENYFYPYAIYNKKKYTLEEFLDQSTYDILAWSKRYHT